MKKTLILGVLGLAASVASSYGQGFIALDNYQSAAQPVILNGGVGIDNTFTVGLYWGQGSFAGAVAPDPGGIADPLSLHASFALATGLGSTAAGGFAGLPGKFFTGDLFQAATAGQAPTGVAPVTVMLVAFNTGSYATATFRGHSAAFQMNTAPGNSPIANFVGDAFSTFSVVPEPSTMALAGLGLASLLFARRRK